MAYYYKINESKDVLPPYKGFHLQKVKDLKTSGPKINYDFSKHVLIELLDDVTPQSKLWKEMGLTGDKNILHKRIMIDSHRIKCRRAIVICNTSDEAKKLAQRLSQTKVMKRCICAVVIQDLLSDLCLFEKQIIQCGDNRSQHQLLYVSDLSRSRGPAGLAQFLKEKFSPFGTILSILVCSDDGDYAYPEGVVKFAYLSEAFAAELAFDQLVVGNERLSVTAHHNIVLSQCDLRIRLRDAQLCCSPDNNESSESYLHSYNGSYRFKHLESINDSVENTMSNLHISHASNLKDNSMYNALEDTLPAFSQYNCHKNSPDSEFDKTVTFTKEMTFDKVQHPPKNVLLMHSDSNSINLSARQSDIYASETMPFEKNVAKIINDIDKTQKCKPRSRKNIALDSLLSIGKSSKTQSDSNSFVTCDSLDPNSNALFLSSKNSQQTNSVLKSQFLSSNCNHLSSPHAENKHEAEVIKESKPKRSKKRKKIFTSSQKLCLKSQRTGLSQDSTLDTDSQVSNQTSSQPQNSQKCKGKAKRYLDLSVTVDNKNTESSQSSKVVEWLSHLPVSDIKEEGLSSKCKIETRNHKNLQSPESSRVANWLLHLPTAGTESSEVASLLSDLPTSSRNKKHSSKKKSVLIRENDLRRSRISIHRTPALNSNTVMRSECEVQYPDDISTENEDPNKMLFISSSDQSDTIPLTDDYRSPLQMWLKQELVSSTNNSVYESKEASKSVIVCATKTGNDFITVGCSHMSCDTCYPDSTDLLLGYC